MSSLSYRVVAGILGLACVASLALATHAAWLRIWPGTDMPCDEWLEQPREGRFLLRNCLTELSEATRSTAALAVHHTDEASGPEVTWQTEDEDLVTRARFLGGDRDQVRRTKERYAVLSPLRDVRGVASQITYDTAYAWVISDERPRPHLPLGGFLFLLFGLPLCLLINRQRRWTAIRLDWERSQGVITEPDRPVSF